MKRTQRIIASPASDIQFLDSLKNTFSAVTGIINTLELRGIEHDVDYLRRTGDIFQTNSTRVVVYRVNASMNQFKEKFGEVTNGNLPVLEVLGIHLLRLQVETRIKRFYVLFDIIDSIPTSEDFFHDFFSKCPLALFVSGYTLERWAADYGISDVTGKTNPLQLQEEVLKMRIDEGINLLVPYFQDFESTRRFHFEAQPHCVFEVSNDPESRRSWVRQFYIAGDDVDSPERMELVEKSMQPVDKYIQSFGNICLSMKDIREKKKPLQINYFLCIHSNNTNVPVLCTLRIVDFGADSTDNRALAEFIRFCPLTSFICLWSFMQIWRMCYDDIDEGVNAYRRSRAENMIEGFDYASEIPHYRQYFNNKAIMAFDGKLALPEQIYIKKDEVTDLHLDALAPLMVKIAESNVSRGVVFISLRLDIGELSTGVKTAMLVAFFERFQDEYDVKIVVAINVSDFGVNPPFDRIVLQSYLETSSIVKFMGYHSFKSLWALAGKDGPEKMDSVYSGSKQEVATQ